MTMTDPAPQQVVPAVFANREAAEAAIAELRRLGFAEEDIGLAVPEPGRYALEGAEQQELWRGTVAGMAVGAPLGALAGILLQQLIVPGGASLGIGGLLLLGLRDGILWGSFLGAASGLLAKVRWNDAEDRHCDIPLGGSDILVVVRAGDRAEEVRRVLEAHGARCFLDQARREA
jgi:hypothetical protein